MENSSQGLVMLDPEHKVVVTGEVRHQPALAGYAPRADGRARRVAVELRFTPAGRIEVLLDGRRVGELTKLMSQRHGRHVNAVLARGERPGAVGLVVDGRRGVEMQLRLPDAGSDAIVDVTSPIPPVPPRPTPPGPDSGRPPRGPRGRFRKPLLIGGGVFTLLAVVAGISGGGDDEDSRTPTVAAALPAQRPAPSSTPVATLDPDPTDDPDADLDRDAVPAAQPAATRAPAARAAEPRTQPEPQRLVALPEPQRQEAPPEPAPEPVREQPEAVESTYYPNCTAVRAAGADPIRAGDPGYSGDLDRDGDGIACE